MASSSCAICDSSRARGSAVAPCTTDDDVSTTRFTFVFAAAAMTWRVPAPAMSSSSVRAWPQ